MWNFRKQKIKTYKSADEFLNTIDIPLLTFDELFDLAENNRIENQTDHRIAEIVMDAERDWIISIHSLSDFLIVLEKEIDGNTTKSNLEKLLKKIQSEYIKYMFGNLKVLPAY